MAENIDLKKMRAIAERSYLLRTAPLITNAEFDALLNEIESLREEVTYLEKDLERCTQFESPMIDYDHEYMTMDERVRRAKARKATSKPVFDYDIIWDDYNKRTWGRVINYKDDGTPYVRIEGIDHNLKRLFAPMEHPSGRLIQWELSD